MLLIALFTWSDATDPKAAEAVDGDSSADVATSGARAPDHVTVHLGDVERPLLVPAPGGGFHAHFSNRDGEWARHFTEGGQALGPAQRHIAPQEPARRRAELPDGQEVVVSERWRNSQEGWDVVAEITEPDGTRRAFQVNLFSPGDQIEPALAVLGEDLVVVWQSQDQDGEGWDIFVRRFGADFGRELGSEPFDLQEDRKEASKRWASRELRVNALGNGDQTQPAILALEQGLAIAWHHRNPGGEEPEGLFLRLLGGLIFADDFESGDLTAWALITNAPIIAAFSKTPGNGFAPLTVQFDASLSQDPNGAITSWDWDFGDGSSGSGEMTSHEFTEPGRFTVTLSVSGAGGLETTSATLDVIPAGTGLTTQVVTLRNDIAPELPSRRAASASVSLLNQTPPGAVMGQATTPLVSVRNDIPPALASSRAESLPVSVNNEIPPNISTGRAESPIVSVRNDGQP